jgi:hypothetical protein
MNKQTITAGLLFILAAITFIISWYLMPDPGTTDTVHILKIVKEERTSVLASVIVQIISSALYISALFFLVQNNFGKKIIGIGVIILIGIGAMGLCADAFFHLLAYYMTDVSVNIQQDVVTVMNFMQTEALVFLVPLLLPLFIGSLVLSLNLAKLKIISKRSGWFISAAFLIGITCAIAAKAGLYSGAIPVLVILGVCTVGQVVAGFEVILFQNELKMASETKNNF